MDTMFNLKSVTGSVIKATETVDFKDSLRTGNQLNEMACKGSSLYLVFYQG